MKKLFFALLVVILLFAVAYQPNVKWLISNKYTQIQYKVFASKKIPRPTDENVKNSSITVTCGGIGLLPAGATLRGKTVLEGSGKITRHQVTIGDTSNTKEETDTFSTTTYSNILYQAYDKNIFALHKIRPTSMKIPAANCTVTFNIDGTNTIIDTNNLRGLKEYDVVMKYARGIAGL